jgi:CheY-like chemotaxis protein
LSSEDSADEAARQREDVMASDAGGDAPLAGRRILVVDDEEDIRVYLTALLEDAGAEVLEACDGDEAITVAQQHRPDLITLDLSMPGRDGIEAFAKLRGTPEIADTPVCVVTGHPEFQKVIYQRSVPPPEGFLSKPIDEARLLADLRRILFLRDRRAMRANPVAPAAS